MSEQTPNSSEDLNGAEPSMEDILASIRKIISDDEPVAMESPEDLPTADLVETSAPAGLGDMMQGIQLDSNDLTSDAVLDAAVDAPDAFMEADESVDLNIDDVLAGLDEDLLSEDVSEVSVEEVSLEEDALTTLVSSEVVPDAEDDILSFLDADIPLDDAELGDEIAADDGLEMDNLLDDILMSPLADEADSLEEEVSADISTSAEDTDLELVKSLMADLADDPSGLPTDEDLDALLAIPDVEEEPDIEDELAAVVADVELADVEIADQGASEVEIASTESESDEDVLGDILDMTIEDELQTHPDDVKMDDLTSLDSVLDAEQDNIAENIDLDDELPSLTEIAAAAEADAVAVETAAVPQAAIATAGLVAAVGGAAIGAADSDETPDSVDEGEATLFEAETEVEIAEAQIEIETKPEPIFTPEETSMPVKAVKTDAILNEVTETAAAGAFAELNQVVEEKAVFSESGPRIGDLVQDALRPMLKEWLDANLKGIVERAVTKEVKRISSGK